MSYLGTNRGRARLNLDGVSKPVPVYLAENANAVLLCHFNEANNSTTLVDATGRHTLTCVDGAKASSGKSKFFSTSLYLDGTADLVSVAGNVSDFAFGNGQFTLETWLWLDDATVGTTRAIMGKGGVTADWSTSTGISWIWYYNNSSDKLAFTYNSAGSPVALASAVIGSRGRWNHFAAVQTASTFKMYHNGTEVYSGGVITITNPTTSDRVYIGDNSVGSDEPFKGYLQELRVLKGEGFYTADFSESLPTAPFRPL